MRCVIQRVTRASVTVSGERVSEIQNGFLVLVGAEEGDTEADARYCADKIAGLRVFEDENGKMNLSIGSVGGSILSISQFTLFADVRKGNRPSFVKAGAPNHAKQVWLRFNDALRAEGLDVKEGRFGAHMRVDIANDGPVTIVMDTDELMK